MNYASKILAWIKQKIFSITFLKFGIVGGSGVVVNYLCFWLLTEFLRLNHLIASIIATEIAILNNFALNDLWTFRERRRSRLAFRIMNFHWSRVLGLLVTVGSLYLLVDLMGFEKLISYIFAIGFGTLTNFFTSDLFVWPER